MLKKVISYFFVVIFLSACTKSNLLDGYNREDGGYYYKLLSLGDGNDHPKPNDVLVTDAVMKTQSDSVFWDTSHDGVNGFYISLDTEKLKGSHHNHFLKLVEGDSVSFLIRPSIFFRLYFDTIVPGFCKNDSLIKLNLKINEVISKAEYLSIKENSEFKEINDTELQELEAIDCYLQQNDKNIQPDQFGIYTLEKSGGNNEKVSIGKKVKISFSGTFLDGRPVGNNDQEMEFIYGTPDQIIKGLNIVIGSLKKGETAKIIVPSRLAFGESGSSNGSIPPYTSLVFKVKIIDIK